MAIGGLSLGGSHETIFNPVFMVKAVTEKGVVSILIPITIHYYLDARDALLKALAI